MKNKIGKFKLNKVYCMDCLKGLKKIPDNSVDAIITDPPYGLGFMGKEWDKFGAEIKEFRDNEKGGFGGYKTHIRFGKSSTNGLQKFVLQWAKECLRVLKPGGHLLSFGGTRTYHRMAVAIEDVGFEIRDMLEWIYNTGFPKSHNIGKAYDKKMGNERENIRVENKAKPTFHSQDVGGGIEKTDNINVTKGNSKWEGFGTALKPAHEPIVLARKPLSEKTIVENCIKYGTGALDIDGCRIPCATEKDLKEAQSSRPSKTSNKNDYTLHSGGMEGMDRSDRSHIQGRFPANLLVTDDALNDGEMTNSNTPKKGCHRDIYVGGNSIKKAIFGKRFTDSGSKSRYFDIDVWGEKHGLINIPKASKSERNKGLEGLPFKRHSDRKKDDGVGGDNPRNRTNTPKQNFHPTVKPLHLMVWLVRLISKKRDIVLDPFIGSGTTAVACKQLNRKFIGFEISEEYCKIANKRLAQKTLNPILNQKIKNEK